jgi:hypothetical protein
MTVVEGWFAGKKYSAPPGKADLPEGVAQDIIKNICLNSKAFYIEEPGKKTEFVGNRTECALLMLCQRDLGVPYDGIRKLYEASVKYVRTFLTSLGPVHLPPHTRPSVAASSHWSHTPSLCLGGHGVHVLFKSMCP